MLIILSNIVCMYLIYVYDKKCKCSDSKTKEENRDDEVHIL